MEINRKLYKSLCIAQKYLGSNATLIYSVLFRKYGNKVTRKMIRSFMSTEPSNIEEQMVWFLARTHRFNLETVKKPWKKFSDRDFLVDVVSVFKYALQRIHALFGLQRSEIRFECLIFFIKFIDTRTDLHELQAKLRILWDVMAVVIQSEQGIYEKENVLQIIPAHLTVQDLFDSLVELQRLGSEMGFDLQEVERIKIMYQKKNLKQAPQPEISLRDDEQDFKEIVPKDNPTTVWLICLQSQLVHLKLKELYKGTRTIQQVQSDFCYIFKRHLNILDEVVTHGQHKRMITQIRNTHVRKMVLRKDNHLFTILTYLVCNFPDINKDLIKKYYSVGQVNAVFERLKELAEDIQDQIYIQVE